MEAAGLELLRAWEGFYLIVGPSAAVLIGLQFVVIVMTAELHVLGDNLAVSAFSSPTIVHYCMALLVSSLLIAPWPTLTWAAATLTLCGLGGVGYALVVIRRATRQINYHPVLEDWIWHGGLPLLAYATIALSGVLLRSAPVRAMFAVGAALVLLLFIGIHNAWDSVVFIGLRAGAERGTRQD